MKRIVLLGMLALTLGGCAKLSARLDQCAAYKSDNKAYADCLQKYRDAANASMATVPDAIYTP